MILPLQSMPHHANVLQNVANDGGEVGAGSEVWRCVPSSQDGGD